ncbi:MAG: YceI family protein [Polyangiaceae bacterium]|nr:YceI family protein [Polyangiaceae bacterium]
MLTRRRGLLARVGHDLLLRVESFEVRLEGDRVTAHADAASLRVTGAIDAAERVDTAALGARDRADIEKNLNRDVLGSARWPRISYEGTWDRGPGRVTGELTLCGERHPLELAVRVLDGRALARVELTPSRWGIRPYRALLGALEVEDRVTLRIDLRAAAGAPAPAPG